MNKNLVNVIHPTGRILSNFFHNYKRFSRHNPTGFLANANGLLRWPVGSNAICHEYPKNRTKKARQCLAENSSGAATRLRTRDLLITSQLLYQLSYSGIKCRGYSIDFSGFGLVSIFEKFFSTNWSMWLVGALPFCGGELGASTLSG